VTMDACEVAKFAQIELQDVCAFASATQVVIGQSLGKKRTAQRSNFGVDSIFENVGYKD
jgi:hypothetical protein